MPPRTVCLLFIAYPTLQSKSGDEERNSSDQVSVARIEEEASPKAFAALPFRFKTKFPRKIEILSRCGVLLSDSEVLPMLQNAVTIELVEILLDEFSDQAAKPLNIFISDTDKDLVESIFTRNTLPENRDFVFITKFRPTPVNLDVEVYPASVKTIIKSGKTVVYRHPKGGTILHYAVEKEYTLFVKFLCEHGALSIDARNKESLTALHLAAQKKGIEIVKALFKKGADLNCLSEGRSPLSFAVSKQQLDISRFLLRKGADPNVGNRLLPVVAGEKVCFALVKLLVEYNCNVNAQEGDSWSPLHVCAYYGHAEVAKYLLDHGANINAMYSGEFVSKRGTPLKTAVCRGHVNVVRLLLEYRANVSLCGLDDVSPLHYAIEAKSRELFELLLNNGAIANCSDKNGVTPLHLAAKWVGETSVAEALLQRGADVNATTAAHVPSGGSTPLMFAAKAKNVNVVKLLLKNGANVDAVSSDGKNVPLLLAAYSQCCEAVETILQYKPDVTNPNNRRAFFYVMANVSVAHDQMFNKMIASGFTVYPDDAANYKLLPGAIRKKCFGIVRQLLAYGAPLSACYTFPNSSIKCTPLHVAAFCGDLDVIKLLVASGADVNAVRYGRKSILHDAVEGSNGEAFKFLFANNTIIRDREELFCLAMKKDCAEIVEYFLLTGTDVNFRFSSKATALMYAAESDSPKVVKLLLKFGARIGLKCKRRRTALHSAARAGATEIFKTLLDNCCGEMSRSFERKFQAHFTHLSNMESAGPGRLGPFTNMFVRHLVRLEAAGVIVIEYHKLHSLVDGKYYISKFAGLCKAEANILRNETIGNSHAKWLDLLLKDVSSISGLVRNPSINHTLKSFNFHRNFPIYGGILHRQYRKGRSKRKLLDKSVRLLNHLSENFLLLPIEVKERISSLMNRVDIMILRESLRDSSVHIIDE